jgi:hypothetical protein
MISLLRATALCVMLSHAVVAQSPVQFLSPAVRTLSADTSNRVTSHFRVGPFGWLGIRTHEKHGVYFYPTSSDRRDSGYFAIDPHNVGRGDFNGDGKEDLAITWALFPHTVERQGRATFAILLNEGNGLLRYAPEMFDSAHVPVRFFAYRTAIADFNADGRPDIVAASMGMVKRNPDGSMTTVYEPIPLALSGQDGKLRDASANIQGQESGGLPAGFTFGHELSAGDVNGDSAVDFFTGKCLFVNDGTGKFRNASASLPQEMRPTNTYLMSSMIGDLNQDGIGDIVALYADGAPMNRTGYILLSKNGDTTLSGRQLVELPAGRYGAGTTKFNHGALGDIDGDGKLDIILGVTRANPYYRGRLLQVLVNKGAGVFEDQTTARVVAPSSLDENAEGEGSLHVVDMDGDGDVDVFHAGSGTLQGLGVHGPVIYINDHGTLRVIDSSRLAWVQPWQMTSFEGLKQWQERSMQRAYPIDLDGQLGLDMVSYVSTPLSSWPQAEPTEITFYSVASLTSVDENGTEVPSDFHLAPNYPNPFNPSTTIRFSVPSESRVTVKVYDQLGRVVATLADRNFSPGSYEARWDAIGMASGLYFSRVEATNTSGERFVGTRKMILMK